jgi:hypothetical protein
MPASMSASHSGSTPSSSRRRQQGQQTQQQQVLSSRRRHMWRWSAVLCPRWHLLR